MTCTRTGCHIWIEPYNEFAYGDAFEVSPFATKDEKIIARVNRLLNADALLKPIVVNIAYFKIVKRSFQPINDFAVKHYTVSDFEELIGGDSIEAGKSYWPPAIMITNNFTNHGYYGVPI